MSPTIDYTTDPSDLPKWFDTERLNICSNFNFRYPSKYICKCCDPPDPIYGEYEHLSIEDVHKYTRWTRSMEDHCGKEFRKTRLMPKRILDNRMGSFTSNAREPALSTNPFSVNYVGDTNNPQQGSGDLFWPSDDGIYHVVRATPPSSFPPVFVSTGYTRGSGDNRAARYAKPEDANDPFITTQQGEFSDRCTLKYSTGEQDHIQNPDITEKSESLTLFLKEGYEYQDRDWFIDTIAMIVHEDYIENYPTTDQGDLETAINFGVEHALAIRGQRLEKSRGHNSRR